MLKSLNIRNFALIDSLEIGFGQGLNIITGETGAGKSIIIDALMVLLGERASVDYVRNGESKAIIEGIFLLPEKHEAFKLLSDNGLDYDGFDILIRREISIKGTSRCFINDTPVQVSLLKQFGDILVDFHGQHDHQSLLRPATHIGILDLTCDFKNFREDYKNVYEQLKALSGKLKNLKAQESQLRQKAEFQRHQLTEIEQISPKENEDIELEAELKILQNAELLFNLTNEAYFNLYDDELSARDKLLTSSKIIKKLSEIDTEFAPFHGEIESAIIAVDEIAKYIFNYNSKIQFDSERIELIRSRNLALRGLIKKYGTLEAVIETQKKLHEELSLVENFDSEIKKLSEKIEELQKDLGYYASQITSIRRKRAEFIEASIEETLSSLTIPNGIFRIKIEQEEITPTEHVENLCCRIGKKTFKAYPEGSDKVEFFISLNAGEEPKPLTTVASGGEVSRIMLSIKSIIADADSIPVMVFDEIDSGISGRVARKAGQLMQKIADSKQIIAITHLPQIAALGAKNFAVEKIESDSKTKVIAKILTGEEKINEVAKLLSGDTITVASLESARELIEL
ncbi:MAG: repair protein RecN [Ignavibacteria bacterium]|nr:repair protein RecN [Ignavibacteria bacterium]